MAAKNTASAPLTFDLRKTLLEKIESYQKKGGIRSKSEVIRDAIESYDYADFQREEEPHRQISVRLPVKQKRELTKMARQKKVSLGVLLRAALEALPEAPPAAKAKPEATARTSKKATAKTAGRKSTAKATAAKKGPVARKKTAADRAPVPAKAPARKAVARRAAAKITTAKRTAPKKTVKRK